MKRAHADAFIEVVTNFIAFLSTLPMNFVFKVFRADAGTVYKAKSVRDFLKSKGIYCQYACIESPHQISVTERNHGILLSTMRAIMSLSHAPKRFGQLHCFIQLFLIIAWQRNTNPARQHTSRG